MIKTIVVLSSSGDIAPEHEAVLITSGSDQTNHSVTCTSGTTDLKSSTCCLTASALAAIWPRFRVVNTCSIHMTAMFVSMQQAQKDCVTEAAGPLKIAVRLHTSMD